MDTIFNFSRYSEVDIKSMVQELYINDKITNRELNLRMSRVEGENSVQTYPLMIKTVFLENYEVLFDDQSRIYDIRGELTRCLKMQHSRDFRIFLENSSKNPRVLDEEEQILKIIQEQKSCIFANSL